MPTSSKPRKPHRAFNRTRGLHSARALTDVLIRGFSGWTKAEKLTFAGQFLVHFSALRLSKGGDPEARGYFAEVKDRLVLAYSLAIVSDREEDKKAVVEADKLLQVAFDCYAERHRMLYPQLKRMQRIAQEQFEGIVEHFEPHQIDAARGNLRPGGKRARMYDKVEADLDQAALGGKHGLRRVSA